MEQKTPVFLLIMFAPFLVLANIQTSVKDGKLNLASICFGYFIYLLISELAGLFYLPFSFLGNMSLVFIDFLFPCH
jgi:hypothetical protein